MKFQIFLKNLLQIKFQNSIIYTRIENDAIYCWYVQWFEDGTYQVGTNREFNAIHIYDLNTRLIAVFKKSTGQFVTTCQLTREEDAQLKATGNFGGQKGWFSGQAKNLPPEQTPVHTFESDIKRITPISTPLKENPSSGITPTNSFESDRMGITPIDKSQSDNW